MLRNCISVGILLILATLTSAAADAGTAVRATADSTLTDATYEEVVVTATRSALHAGKVPASFSVIDRPLIEALQPRDLVDLVRLTPGITFNGIGIGGRRTFSVRGMTDSQTLVLVDGRRQIDTNENIGYSDFGHDWVPVDAVDRVEIVRGPLSSIWGSEALGGVINIITRRPGDRWRGSLRVRGGLPDQDDLGEEFSLWLHAGGPVIRDRAGLTVSAEKLRENNIPARTQPYPGAVIDAREEKLRTGGRTRLDLALAAGHRLEFSGGYSDEERYTRSWDTRRDEPRDYDYHLQRSDLSAEYTGLMGTTELRLRAFRTLIKTRRTYVPQGIESLKEAGDRIASGELVHTGFSRHLATLGGEIREEELDVPGFNAGEGGIQSTTHRAVFAQDDVSLSDRLALVLGARYDHHRIFGGEVSPRAYLVWDARPGLQIKGGYGHGFKAPSLKQIHPDYYYDIATMIIVGNPDLSPETVDTLELGARWRRGRGRLGATLFTNDIENLIDTRVIGYEGRKGIFQPQNILSARTRGVETEAGWRLGRGVRLEANWTYLDARDLTLDTSLPDRPRHTVNAIVRWRESRHDWRALLRFEHRGSQWLEEDETRYRADGYGLWHLNLGKDFGDRLAVDLGVENLFDTQLDDVSAWFNFYEPGRCFTLGARLALP